MNFDFQELYHQIRKRLEDELAPYLQYHSPGHTLDVLEQAVVIAGSEGLEDPDDILLLKISSLYHDCGFLSLYNGHEEASCSLACSELPAYGLSSRHIELVCGMIRATRVPQQPHTLLEEIICDADLDYLGRSDFFEKGNLLYHEFLDQGIVKNFKEWNLLQIRFLESHHYFTKTSRAIRDQQKKIHLEMIRSETATLD